MEYSGTAISAFVYIIRGQLNGSPSLYWLLTHLQSLSRDMPNQTKPTFYSRTSTNTSVKQRSAVAERH